jgi:hypothetical protein
MLGAVEQWCYTDLSVISCTSVRSGINTMTAPTSTERRPLRWGWLLAGFLCLAVVTVGILLAYPAFRQRQLLNHLRARGFDVTPRDVGPDWRAAWLNQPWVPVEWRRGRYQELIIRNRSVDVTPEDFAVLTELASGEIRSLISPPRCWLALNLRNITEWQLAQLQPRIQYLTASGPFLTDQKLIALKRTPHLTELNLNSDQIGDDGLSHLVALKDLVRVNINGRRITDAGLAHLSGLKMIRYLGLSGTQITDAGLVHLAGLKELQHLDLSGAQITGSGLSHLTRLNQLRTIILNKNPLQDSGLKLLQLLRNLNRLDLRDTPVTDVGLTILTEFKRLMTLDLSGTQITNAGIPDGNSLPPQLFELKVERTQITSEHILSLQKSNQALSNSPLRINGQQLQKKL